MQHYTRNTVSTSKYCPTCKRVTQHAVHDRRIAHCLEHGDGVIKSEVEIFEFLSAAEQIRLERIAFAVEAAQVDEWEAEKIVNQAQGELEWK